MRRLGNVCFWRVHLACDWSDDLQAAALCLSLLTALPGWPSRDQLAASPPEAALLRDVADGHLDDHDLLDASLIAAGAVGELTQFRARYEQLESQLAGKFESNSTATNHGVEQAKRLLADMHRVALTGHYDAACSDLRRTLAAGDYNCVSATILYLALCRRHGLRADAIAVPAHVFCQLPGLPPIDVQTTCSVWLGKGRDPNDKNAPRRVLDEIELVGKVYYNRGVLELQQSRFEEAIRLLRLSLRLDPDDRVAHNNLLAAVNNWALAEADLGRFARASQLLETGRGLDDSYAPLLANDLHIHQRWVRQLCQQEQFGRALRVLQEGLSRRPRAELFREGRFLVIRLWAEALWADELIDEGFQLFDGLQRPEDQLLLAEAEVQAVTAAAARLAARRRRQAALSLVERAESRHADDPRLTGLRAFFAQSTASTRSN